jgi:putative phage-type endonuclease
MGISQNDITEYILSNVSLSQLSDQDKSEIKNNLMDIYYDVNFTSSDEYVLDNLINYVINQLCEKYKSCQYRKQQLQVLKQLKLPEQRSPEWYEMRKDKLTASSMASALGKCHFTSRNELLLDKIIEKPYVANPITEHGVKYEDVAIQFYEELYNTKIVDFGMIPHPEFEAFGASPDGICDDTGNDEYVGRMVEIKCPPKRKFTKTVPPHYWQQVQGQLEVCNLDECDFFQVKIVDYESYEEYCKDIFTIDDDILPGRNKHNYPKGVTLTYKVGETLSYVYCELNKTNEEYLTWIESQTKENLFETKWWNIERYETTLVVRDKQWWLENMEHILSFYKDLLYYKGVGNVDELRNKVEEEIQRKKKRKQTEVLLDSFLLISDDED